MTAVVAAVEGFLKPETRAWADRHAADVAWLDRDAEAYWRLSAGPPGGFWLGGLRYEPFPVGD